MLYINSVVAPLTEYIYTSNVLIYTYVYIYVCVYIYHNPENTNSRHKSIRKNVKPDRKIQQKVETGKSQTRKTTWPISIRKMFLSRW